MEGPGNGLSIETETVVRENDLKIYSITDNGV